MSKRLPALIVAAALVVAAAIIGTAWLMSGRSEPAQAAEPARVLPDGRAATAAEDAYLNAVEPHLSADNAGDVSKVLGSGQDGVCGVWTNPSQTQALAVQLLIDSSGYNETEATVIARAASEHLCPEKG